MMPIRINSSAATFVASLAFVFAAQAQDKEQKHVTQPEVNYQAGTSPLAN